MRKYLTAAALSLSAVLSAGSAEKLFYLDFENLKATKDVTGTVAVRSYGELKSVPGVEGNAAYFSGKKTAIRSTSKSKWKFDPETSFTIEFYIKPERNPADGWSYPAMLNGLRFAGRPKINTPFLFINGTKKRLATIGVGPESFNDGKWHHIAMARDAVAREVSYFCDGKKIATVKESKDMTDKLAVPDQIYIGAAGYLSYYKGAIDEFIIWKGVKKSFGTDKIKKLNTVKQPPVEISKDVAESWKVLKENKINLLPAPKKIKITGAAFAFDPSVWSVKRKEKSDAPGFEHFVKRLEFCNVKGSFSDAGKKHIIAGLYKDVAKELSFKAGCQPRQGYVIDVTDKKIVIAGTDADGLRYGWLTLSALLNESGKMHRAQITDYPDFLERGGHYSPYAASSAASLKRTIDQVFLLRLNRLYCTQMRPLIDMPAYVKEINDYAFERGIVCSFIGIPSVEDIKDYRKKIPRGQDHHAYSYRTDEGMFGWYGHAISWSRDDLAEEHAVKAANYMKKHGFRGFMIHPVDAGGIDNPCRWNSRSPKCRARWGNDFFSAQENLMKIYCDTLRKHYPEINIYYVAYPYMPSLMVNGKWPNHLRRLLKGCGPDVKQIVREGVIADMQKLAKITPAVFTVFYPYTYDYRPIHCNAGRYFASFYVRGLNSLASYEIWSPAGGLCNASRYTYSEYLWNHNAPGAANIPEGLYTNYELISERNAEIEDELLPRACAYMYGEKAAEVMTKVFASKVSERYSAHPFKVLPISIDQEQYFASQVRLTDELLAGMMQIRQFIKPSVLDAWKQKYNFISTVNIGSRARLHSIMANKFAAAGKIAEAQAEAEKGVALLKSKKSRGYPSRKLLLRELDISEKLKSGTAKRAYASQGKHRNINVAFYQYAGTGNGGSTTTLPLMSSFDKMGGISTSSVSDPSRSALKNVDVMIFSATAYVGDTSEDWRTNIRDMVEKDGKGVIFSHNAVGRNKNTNLEKTIFPEICAGFDSRVPSHPELIVADESLFKGFLKKGDKYKEGYVDHMAVIPGKNAKVLLKDDSGKVVAVAGKVGKGFVVYTGEIFGIGKKDVLQEPAMDNWKMLYHLIRYASGE